MYEQDRLKVDFWKEMAIWEVYQIPYLFLGYEPPPAHDSYRLDDIVSLDEHDGELRWQYEKLIRDAIDSGALISDPFARTTTTPLRAVGVIKWRKNKTSIEPVQIYREMEKEIQESDTAVISEVTKAITHNANKARSDDKKTRVELIEVFTNIIYEAMRKKGLQVKGINGIRIPLHYSKDEFYKAFYIENPSVKKIKIESFFPGNEISQIVKFKSRNKPSNTNRIIDLLKS